MYANFITVSVNTHDEAAVFPYPNGVCWTIAITSVTLIKNPYNNSLFKMLKMVTSISDRICVLLPSEETSNQKALGSVCVGSAVSIAVYTTLLTLRIFNI
jgi:hypothetical protein